MGNLDEAISDYAEALSKSQTDDHIRGLLSGALLRAGRREEATEGEIIVLALWV